MEILPNGVSGHNAQRPVATDSERENVPAVTLHLSMAGLTVLVTRLKGNTVNWESVVSKTRYMRI